MGQSVVRVPEVRKVSNVTPFVKSPWTQKKKRKRVVTFRKTPPTPIPGGRWEPVTLPGRSGKRQYVWTPGVYYHGLKKRRSTAAGRKKAYDRFMRRRRKAQLKWMRERT